MSGATCPACGVVVMPGYARCPKCRAPLPSGGVKKGVAAGGTAVEDRAFPVLPLVGAVVVIGGLVAFFALRQDKPGARTVVPSTPAGMSAPTPAGITPTVVPTTVDPVTSTGPSADTVAGDLQRTLSKQRLWSEVEVNGPRIDVRSGSCEDKDMGASIELATPSLHGAGLTKLRCLDKSGRVAFERDL